MVNKKGYYMGGGGVNEPTPGKKKYKSDPALLIQPRFEEPLYFNYDLYNVPGKYGPGAGYHDLQKYKSISEFLEARRKKLRGKYVAEDSWILDNNEKTKKNPNIKARVALLNKIIKLAKEECKNSDIEYTDRRDAYICGKCFHMSENCGGPIPTSKELHAGKNHNPDRIDWRNGPPTAQHYEKICRNCGTIAEQCRCMGDKVKYYVDHCYKCQDSFDKEAGGNFDYGRGMYTEMSEGKIDSVDQFHYTGGPGALMNLKKKKDVNHIDFPIDDQVNRQNQMVYPEEAQYQMRRMMGDDYQIPSGGDSMDPEYLNISLTTPQIAGEHSYLPLEDFQDRSDDALNFGRDYDDEAELPKDFDLKDFEDKYLETSESDLFGLPDGIDPISDLDPEETVDGVEPYGGTSDIGTQIYDDKWNI